MRHTTRRVFLAVALVAGICSFSPRSASAQAVITERLDSPSTLTVRFCRGACACPPHDGTSAVRGRFTLVATTPDPLFDHYDITGVDFNAEILGYPYRLTGSGTYRVGGEFARMHQMVLNLRITTPFSTTDGVFDSGLVVATGGFFPRIDIAAETPTIICTEFALDIHALPTCAADWNADGAATPADVALFVNDWQQDLVNGTHMADFDRDGQTTPADVASFVTAWFHDAAATCTP